MTAHTPENTPIDIIFLIEQLERLISSGRNMPLTSNVIIDQARALDLLDQLRAHFDWLDQMLADGRSFLQGPAAGLADVAAYHPVWFLRQNFGSAAAPRFRTRTRTPMAAKASAKVR